MKTGAQRQQTLRAAVQRADASLVPIDDGAQAAILGELL
jgi:hypothetical protein